MEQLQVIQSKIYEIRGQKVMLDRDLAEMYGVQTKVLNQAVKRNIERFPEDFMFQLTGEETYNWRSQFVTSNSVKMGLRRSPYAFTELGVAMLSSILNSKLAIQVNSEKYKYSGRNDGLFHEKILPLFVIMKQIVVYIVVWLCLSSGVMQAQTSVFPLPEVPQMLVSPTDRANYLAAHYWDRFDFKDNSLIGKAEITEQGFANFISIMPYVTEKEEAFAVFAKRMTENPKMLAHLLEVSERYLFDNFSPVYDEELYRLFLDAALKQPRLSLAQRERLRYHQEVVSKNRVGSQATDFGFVLRNGKRMHLKDVKADCVLLYLNDPECHACQEVKEKIQASETINRWLKSRKLVVLSVCIEGKTEGWKRITAPSGWMDACDVERRLLEHDLYDLRNLPAVYLLDGNRQILVKNATLDKVEQILKQRR